jgi:hypothetical protein
VLLSIATASCISAQRQKLNDEYVQCMKQSTAEDEIFIRGKLQRMSDLDDRAFAGHVDSCKTQLNERRRKAAVARAEEEKKQKAAEGDMAAAAKKQKAFYQDNCYPLEMQTSMLCNKKIEELAKLFQFNDGICASSVRLLHKACFNGGWDEVLSEQDLTTRGVLMADYESRTVLGGCLLQSNNTLELEYASNETRTKCLALAGAVKEFIVATTVKTKMEGGATKKSAAAEPPATPRPR